MSATAYLFRERWPREMLRASTERRPITEKDWRRAADFTSNPHDLLEVFRFWLKYGRWNPIIFPMKIHLRKSKNKQCYFTIQARNGRVLVTSETYHHSRDAWKAISALRKGFADQAALRIVDDTLAK